jgi:hypothetical protein
VVFDGGNIMPINMYECCVENQKQIGQSMDYLSRTIHAAIATNKSSAEIDSLIRLQILTLGIWAEARLQKIMNEPNSFTDTERSIIRGNRRSKIDQWKVTVDLAYAKSRSLPVAYPINVNSLSLDDQNHRQIIHDILDQELKEIIEIRNKLAHSQWAYPLNSNNSNINTQAQIFIQNENILTLTFRYNLLVSITNIIRDLVVSYPTHRRDFSKIIQQLSQDRINMKTRKYSKYQANLRQSYQKHLAKF